ncbi:ATP-binding cassette domain-containing protein [Levilactobacillus tujiorum]|uniref:ABC transporter ATP-binding protein n=1 Tax=Levilactobacillus tujiorum TaxID=2912243 RepID=A0ABX1L7P2_9LACO|nr:ABC transporter ATP-binding protein [Levilactobacillus tujiorum]MCH5465290.1 ABC transporter ATP-binding protein [Levilactobacillus tujiorum]NLR12281.1 ABC transporter ATP-binding protein [Lactobacillus sp. HBUAS51387]NLR30293.1 ABC transporter ATP-binding protein [Levilactobacillus tujiorum]
MTNVLAIDHVGYKHNFKTILHDVDLTLEPGKIIGLLGENGAGKTTLMRLITGGAKGSGTIAVCGDTQAAHHRSHVSFTEQLRGFSASTRVEQVASFYRTVYTDFDGARFEELVTFLQIDTSLKIAALSKGMKEKVIIALTLARQVNLYLLDEPFSGIDSMSRKRIISSILKWKPTDATMVISDHYVSEIAPILDEVVIVKDQTVYAHQAADDIRAEFGVGIERYYESLYEGSGQRD